MCSYGAAAAFSTASATLAAHCNYASVLQSVVPREPQCHPAYLALLYPCPAYPNAPPRCRAYPSTLSCPRLECTAYRYLYFGRPLLLPSHVTAAAAAVAVTADRRFCRNMITGHGRTPRSHERDFAAADIAAIAVATAATKGDSRNTVLRGHGVDRLTVVGSAGYSIPRHNGIPLTARDVGRDSGRRNIWVKGATGGECSYDCGDILAICPSVSGSAPQPSPLFNTWAPSLRPNQAAIKISPSNIAKTHLSLT
jgi:hypothetical protein